MDVNYAHQFTPNTKGLCKVIVGGRKRGYEHCGLPADSEVHRRFRMPLYPKPWAVVPNPDYKGTLWPITHVVRDAEGIVLFGIWLPSEPAPGGEALLRELMAGVNGEVR